MPTRFWPFDSVDGDRNHDSLHPASALRSVFEGEGGVRVTPAMEDLLVQATTPASMEVGVSTGSAFIRGRYFEVFGDPEFLTIPPASAEARVDRVVLRLDLDERTVGLLVLQGTSGSATPPSLTRTSTVWDFSLAQVEVPGNATEVTTVVDERADADVCGFVRIAQTVLRTGDTMAGDLTLAGDPSSALHASPKQYVDAGDAEKVDRVNGDLRGYVEPGATPGNSGTVTLNLAAHNVFEVTPTAQVDFAFSGLPSAGNHASATIIVHNDSHPITFPAGTQHPGGEAPALDGKTYLSLVVEADGTVVVGQAFAGVA